MGHLTRLLVSRCVQPCAPRVRFEREVREDSPLCAVLRYMDCKRRPLDEVHAVLDWSITHVVPRKRGSPVRCTMPGEASRCRHRNSRLRFRVGALPQSIMPKDWVVLFMTLQGEGCCIMVRTQSITYKFEGV